MISTVNEPPGNIIMLEPEPELKLDQRELRELLVVKLRALIADIEVGQFGKKYPNAGQIRQRVDRLRDIAGVME